jgi:hypothetical protein
MSLPTLALMSDVWQLTLRSGSQPPAGSLVRPLGAESLAIGAEFVYSVVSRLMRGLR